MTKIENVINISYIIKNRLEEIEQSLEIIDRAITESFDPNYAEELDELRLTEFGIIKKTEEMEQTLQELALQMQTIVDDWNSQKRELQDRYFTFDAAGKLTRATKEEYDAVTDPDAEEENIPVDF